MKKYLALSIDPKTVLEIIELAKKHGKQAGDSMQAEFEEIYKKKPDKFKLLGATDQDVDMITGNLREKNLKILNLKEIDRRKKKKQWTAKMRGA